jgi:hypothetical protein
MVDTMERVVADRTTLHIAFHLRPTNAKKVQRLIA